MTLGGSTRANAESYGLTMGKIPAQNVDKAIVKVSEFYSREKRGDETLSDVVARLGKTRVKEELKEFMVLPTFQESPGFYQDTRQPWQYKRSIGIGECAGEVVDQAEFMLEDADRIHFESTLDLERNRYSEASTKAFDACRKAADALLFTKGLWLSDNYDTVEEFRRHFYDSNVFYRPFADNFLRSAQEGPSVDPERARLRVEEATLFIEAAQGVYSQASDF